MKNTKIIIIANDQRERNVICARLRELRDELSTCMSSGISNYCWDVYLGKAVKISIYLKGCGHTDGLRCDYFAISTFDLDYVEKWQRQLSPHGKELTSFNEIKEKIAELISKEDIAVMSDYEIVKQYMDNEVQAAAIRYQVCNAHYIRPLKTLVPAIKKVIFNDPATIVFWVDGTKTVVKAQNGDIFDPEKGLTMAISKKALGNKGNYCNELKKWLPEEETVRGSCTMSEFVDSLRKLGKLASKTPFFIPKLDSEAEYNPVQKAYDILVGWRDGKVPVSKEISDNMPEIDEIIGYLGEALDD